MKLSPAFKMEKINDHKTKAALICQLIKRLGFTRNESYDVKLQHAIET